MSDSTTTVPIQSTMTPQQPSENQYRSQIDAIFANNKLTDAQSSLKQIAKLLQGINHTPKSRQIPTSNFIVKKFVLGVKGASEFLQSLGFTETTIHNTAYLSLPDQHPTIDQSSSIASELLNIAATNPLAKPTPTPTTTTMDDTTSTDSKPTTTTDLDDKKDDKKEEQKEEPVVAKHCTSGCGFYGSKQFDGMCSSCYKKANPTSTSATTTKIGAKPNDLRSLLKIGSTCATPKCKYQPWKNAPNDWEMNLITLLDKTQPQQDSTTIATTTMTDDTTPNTTTDDSKMSDETTTTTTPPTAPTTPTKPLSATTPSASSTTSPSPMLFCQYCTLSNAQHKYYKSHEKTISDKRRLAMVKIQSIAKMSKVMRIVQEDKTRCYTCRRKLGIAPTECRCKLFFCGLHRYPQTHDCTFDHMERYTANLAKSTLNDITKGKLENDDE